VGRDRDVDNVRHVVGGDHEHEEIRTRLPSGKPTKNPQPRSVEGIRQERAGLRMAVAYGGPLYCRDRGLRDIGTQFAHSPWNPGGAQEAISSPDTDPNQCAESAATDCGGRRGDSSSPDTRKP